MDTDTLLYLTFIFMAIVFIAIVVLYLPQKFNLDFFEFLYVLLTGQLRHHASKRVLVRGDLVFVQYGGALRKAYVTEGPGYTNTVQLCFEDMMLNTKDIQHNQYDFSRIYLPEYLSAAAKILYSIGGKFK